MVFFHWNAGNRVRTVVLRIMVPIAALLLIGAGIIVVKDAIFPAGAVITMTETGFVPDKLTARVGETITFKTVLEKPFWPASDPHPVHTAFPDFDSKKPVPAGEEWQYTFIESGVYEFHDHIASLFRGTIYVEGVDGKIAKADCSVEKNVQCWSRLVRDVLRDKGIKAAFDKVVELNKTEPSFGDDCHAYAHLIGESAYNLYVQKKNFELTPAAALCGYGFYHGFMETLMLTTGDFEEARSFCRVVDEKLRNQSSAAATACYHGIGHGIIDGSDPTTWGDAERMMAPGFALCERMAETDMQYYLCATGVFNSIEILARDPKYNLVGLLQDPFEMCNEQPIRHREACYSNLVPVQFDAFGDDFDKILAYVNDRMIDKDAPAVDGKNINDQVTVGVLFEYIRLHGADSDYIKNGIDLCRRQPSDDYEPCVEGLSGGHLKYGAPGAEYEKNLRFCKDEYLNEIERNACYRYFLTHIDINYNPEKVKEICGAAEVTYRERYCPA